MLLTAQLPLALTLMANFAIALCFIVSFLEYREMKANKSNLKSIKAVMIYSGVAFAALAYYHIMVMVFMYSAA